MLKQIAPALVVALLLGDKININALNLENKAEFDEWMTSYEDILAQLDDPEPMDDELEDQLAKNASSVQAGEQPPVEDPPAEETPPVDGEANPEDPPAEDGEE